MGQFLSPETDRICQFLGTETDIMDETYYIIAIDYANVYAPAITLSMPLTRIWVKLWRKNKKIDIQKSDLYKLLCWLRVLCLDQNTDGIVYEINSQ